MTVGDGTRLGRGTLDPATTGGRRRPKNRRAQIAATAAGAFGAAGYHGVSMEDIARALGISSAALYRHYPSKYALFAEELLWVGRKLALAAEKSGDDPARTMSALVSVSLEHRATVALLRWEGRYLEPADHTRLREYRSRTLAALDHRIATTRPGLAPSELRVLSTAMLGVVLSVADHHAALPARSTTTLLAGAGLTVATTELPHRTSSPRRAPAVVPDSFKHELLLRRAVELFHERGYPNVSVEEIATAAGLSAASAVYRFYRSKSDLLAAAFRRAAERASSAVGPAVAAAEDSAHALILLIDEFVTEASDERALTFVYFAEFGHVPADERAVLRNIQRLTVQEWARLVCQVRPHLSPAEARFLVHAAFAIVIELGQDYGDEPVAGRERVAALLRGVLLG